MRHALDVLLPAVFPTGGHHPGGDRSGRPRDHQQRLQLARCARLAVPLAGLAWKHRLTTLPIDNWTAFALLFIGVEFCYYWFHRASHRIRWFWATHAVHHSSNDVNLSAAYRFGWTGRLSGTSVFY